MEKLIKLLNEYKKIKGYDWDTKIINYNTNTLSFTNGYSLLDYEIVIWKRYGFIKRLVDNDKIDLWKIKKLYRKSNEHSTHTYPILYDYSYDESLLMYLSIQDKPIEFLISILR